MKKRISSSLALMPATALMLLALPGCSNQTQQQPQGAYEAIILTLSDAETVERFPATIKGRQDVEIFPQVSGKLISVDVKEGQRVKKGQTLFVIDQMPYKAALQTAEANLTSAKAEEASARLNHEGKTELHNEKIISDFELKKAENTLLIAKAACARAAAQVTDARNNLSYTVITSPCNGVVGTLPYRAGHLVGPDMPTPLTTVSDNSEMHVYFSLPENRMIELIRTYGSCEKTLESMPAVSLLLNDGSLYGAEGHIESISGVIDNATGATSVRAVFKNPTGLLHSGGTGNVGLVKRSKGVVQIPQSATYELQDKVYAYRVIGGKTKAVQLKVSPMKESNSYIVHSGLTAGDTIVTEGVGNLQDDMAIKLKNIKR